MTPEDSRTAEEMLRDDATYPGSVRFLAYVGDEPAGAASAARIFVFTPDFDGLWCELGVREAHRGRGVGTALHRAASAVARERGKSAFHIAASEARPEGIAWLSRRGYTEYERSRTVVLDLTRVVPPAIDPPPGVEVVSMAERPDLARAVYEFSFEALADVPTGGEPMHPGTYEEFRRTNLENPGMPVAGYVVALDHGEVVGYACVVIPEAHPDRAFHWMTGVRRSHRGRGIAQALKRAQIAWAKSTGLVELETENAVGNAPMRAVNARLGYEPRPDWVILRGPLT